MARRSRLQVPQQVPPIGGEQEQLEEHEHMEEQEETVGPSQGNRQEEIVGPSQRNPLRARGGGDMRFSTEDITKLRRTMSEHAVNRIREVAFQDCLEISLSALKCRDLVRLVTCNCEVVNFNGKSYILFNMDPENPRYLAAEAINVILGAPTGEGHNAQPPSAEDGRKLDQLLRDLLDLDQTDKITNDDILVVADFAKQSEDVDLEATCFFLLLFNGLLMPSTSQYISARSIRFASDLAVIGRVNWCEHALNNIANSFVHRSVYNPATLLTFWLDIIDWGHQEDSEPITPRIKFYTREKVLELAGKFDPDNIKLKPWEDTVYAKNGIVQPQIPKEQREETQTQITRKRLNQDARKKEAPRKRLKQDARKKEDGTSVPIPLLKDLLKPCLEKLPRDMQSASIIVVDQAQQELASSLKRVINDHVTSIATAMASQFQADADRAGNSNSKDPMTSLGVDSAGNSVDPVDPVTPLDDDLPNIGIGDSASALPVDPVTPLNDGLPNIGIGDSASALPVDPVTPLDDGLSNIGIGDSASALPVDPVTPLDDGLSNIGIGDSASALPYIGHPVNSSRVNVSLPPYPFLFSRLDAIDAKKVPASAARILADIKMRQRGKISTDNWPDFCRKLSLRFKEAAAREKEKNQQTGTEKESGKGEETLHAKRRKRPAGPTRRSTRNISSQYSRPPFASPLFHARNAPTKDMVEETISYLCSSNTLPEEETLITIRRVSITKRALTELFLTDQKISLDIMRAFVLCFRSDNCPKTKFLFLPQSMESIESGELKNDFLQALDQNQRSQEEVLQCHLIFIPVIGSDGRIFVFCYNARNQGHKKLEFLSCQNSVESWSEGDTMCSTIFDKLQSAVGKLTCDRNCHVNWSSNMDKISDGSLLALLFMDSFFGDRDWLKDDMIRDFKGIVVHYLLYHKLNEGLPKEFPGPLPNDMQKILLRHLRGTKEKKKKSQKVSENSNAPRKQAATRRKPKGGKVGKK